jgi:hypothetical protein
MNKILTIIATIIGILIIWYLFIDNASLKTDLSEHQAEIETQKAEIIKLETDIEIRNDSIEVQNIIIDSLKAAYEKKKEVVIKYTEVEKKVYFEQWFEDSTQIILMNEERLFLIDLVNVQSKKYELLETNMNDLTKIKADQQDIIQKQEIFILKQDKEIRKLRNQNRAIKIGSAIVITGLLIFK